jgi:hypothetical protein
MLGTLTPVAADLAQPSTPSAPSSLPNQDSSVALRLSGALAVVASMAAVIGSFFPSVFRDAPVTVGNAQGTSVVLLLIGLPTLVGSMLMARAGSRRAVMVWLGTLLYVVYNSVMFTFAAVFNSLFLVNVAMLSLAVWSVVALLRSIDLDAVPRWFEGRVPGRSIGAFMVLTALAFAALWLADILPAIVANTSPASLRGTRMNTNPVEILDLAFTLPLCALAGISLWRRRALGYLLTGTLLVMLTIESAGIAVDQWFGHVYDPSQPLGTVPMFVGLTVVNGVVMLVLLRKVRQRS